ncbi:hypothetical protein ScPMuIL_010498 [Solemya velum]
MAARLLALLLLLLEGCNAKSKTKCIERGWNSTLDNVSRIVISCGRGYVIYRPEAVAGRGTCADPSCNGDSPDLMFGVRKCNWKSRCVLDFPVLPMLSGYRCINKRVDFVDLSPWKCIPLLPTGNGKCL